MDFAGLPREDDSSWRSKKEVPSESNKFVPEQLRKAAAIYEERNALYGDNYRRFGAVMLALFPDGLMAGDASDIPSALNRLGVLVQVVSKLTRYCQNFGKSGHADSLDDLVVYAMMLQELDEELRERDRAPY